MSEPDATARRLAEAVLAGDGDAALALADVVIETYQRGVSGAPIWKRLADLDWSTRTRSRCQELVAGPAIERLPALRFPDRVWEEGRLKAIVTLGDLLGYSAAELLRHPGVGPVVLAEIRAKLAVLGLRLRDDPPPKPEANGDN